jgi:endonuclease-3 related protein
MVGAILTQSAAWQNVEKAIKNLNAAGLMAPAALRQIPTPELAQLIPPTGYSMPRLSNCKPLYVG